MKLKFMKGILSLVSIAICCFASDAPADPKDDAEFMASASAAPEAIEEVFVSLKPSVIASLSRAYSERNIKLPATDDFFNLFLEELTDVIYEMTQDIVVDYYLNNFSESELSEIAAFFRSDAGQAYTSHTPHIMRRMSEVTNTLGLEAISMSANRMERRI